MTPNQNAPAFPCPVGHIECEHPTGMTLRTYVATQILSAMITTEVTGNGMLEQYEPRQTWPKRCAEKALVFTDALIAELNKTP